MNANRFLVAVMGLLFGFGIAQAADVPGSKDPPNLKRYQGSEIIGYATRSYAQYAVAQGGGSPNGGFEKSEIVQGSVTRAIYRVPTGHTSLELIRNYQQMLAAAGFTQTFELIPGPSMNWDGYFYNKFFEQAQPGQENILSGVGSPCYTTAKAKKGGQDLTVAVLAVESRGGTWHRPDAKDPVVIKPGEVLVLVDEVNAKAVENKMVEPKADATPKDPQYLKRYQNSEIIGYATRSYAQYTVAQGGGTPNGGFEKPETIEGAVTRAIYRVPEGHTSLELVRNYQQMLNSAGFTQTFELIPGPSMNWDGYFYNKFFEQAQPGQENILSSVGSPCYITAKARKSGQDLTVAVLAVESRGGTWHRPDAKDPVVIKPGEVLVLVDEVSAKAVENKMVEVKAETMAKALKETGKVDIYGILFDTDKTEIKPQSKSTLDEVAKLLKNDSSLKLEVAGHTDNTGGADHNVKLSQGRAAAVVQALVKNYGINSARLQAKGYGDTKPVAPNDNEDGRAKNRRVELRKL